MFKCWHTATVGLRVERGYRAPVCGCTGTTVNVKLLHLHARTFCSPVTTLWCGGCVHCTECPLFNSVVTVVGT